MHVLILNWKDVRHPDVGGAEIIAFELAKRLVALGHQVTWFCRQFPGGRSEERIDGVRIVRRGGLLTTYLHAPRFYLRSNPRPDVVVDMVNTLCWQTPIYAGRGTVAYVNQLAREVLFYHLPAPISWLAYALERFQYVTYRRCPILCYSGSTKADLVGIGIPEENIGLFPLGIDHSRYRPANRKSPHPFFVFVGRLARMKRADLCIAAMPYVLERHAEAKLAIVGYGPEEDTLRSQIRELGLETAVSLVTRDAFHLSATPGDAKVELMQASWAHVLPSVKEGWGMVVTEAAACGTPSIVTDVSGLRDSVIADETGLVVSATATPSELADAMNRIIEDTDLRDRLTKGALSWAQQFDWETSFQRFYDHLLAQPDRSRLASADQPASEGERVGDVTYDYPEGRGDPHRR